MSNADTTRHEVLLRWTVGAGPVLLLLFIAWEQGVFNTIFTGDVSRISLVIPLAFCAINLHALLSVVRVSSERNLTTDLHANLVQLFNSQGPVTRQVLNDRVTSNGESWIRNHIQNILHKQKF
ncbi:MAG: hypothetical protein AAF420_16590, partial [Pseudomonadota bacterium]